MTRDFKGIWIPKEIWLSKELTVQERLFLVEIDSLDNEEGCFASNGYFAEFFDISKTRVSLVIKSLVDKGYIKSNIIYKEGTKEVTKRVLNISYRGCLTKVREGTQQKLNTPPQEKLKDNNTLPNNTTNNTFNINTFFEHIWSLYPLKKGKGSIKDKQKKILYDLGDEVISKCISRYVAEMKGKEDFYKHGSTFFNSGYIDYLDGNYQEVKSKPPQQQKQQYKQAANDNKRQYQGNDLEKMLLGR